MGGAGWFGFVWVFCFGFKLGNCQENSEGQEVLWGHFLQRTEHEARVYARMYYHVVSLFH